MKENKTKKENNKIAKNKKVKVISITLLLLLVIVGVVSFTYSQNIKLAKHNIEEQEVETQKAQIQEIVLEDNEHMHVETDVSGDKVPVPNGFVGSKVSGENEIDSGYVIYALNEGETEETVEINDANKYTAQKTRNQYVWVPVPDISKFYGTDANGKRWGKIYNFTTGTSSNSTFDEVTGTYALNWSEIDGVMKISNSTNNNYREPDVVAEIYGSTFDMDSKIRILGLGVETTLEFLMQLEKEFNKMIDSVKKYGGFYIGRYETGDLGEEQAVVRKENSNINYQTWYTMYKRCKKLEVDNIDVTTGMIWGNQWDRTLMWLMEMNAKNQNLGKTKEEVISDSTSWGNYYNTTFEYVNSSGDIVTKKLGSGIIIPTGSTEYTKANNIYDLAGNVKEWTMEAVSTYLRVERGGMSNSNISNPASYRTYSAPTSDVFSYCCRATLCIR